MLDLKSKFDLISDYLNTHLYITPSLHYSYCIVYLHNPISLTPARNGTGLAQAPPQGSSAPTGEQGFSGLNKKAQAGVIEILLSRFQQ